MNSWDATAPFPLSRRDMLKTRSWRHGTLTKVILLSTFIFNLLTFRNLSQRLKVKNGDFKHFTCISAWEIRAWHVQSHPGWVGPPNFFWGFFSHGIYVWAYTRQNLRNFGFLNQHCSWHKGITHREYVVYAYLSYKVSLQKYRPLTNLWAKIYKTCPNMRFGS